MEDQTEVTPSLRSKVESLREHPGATVTIWERRNGKFLAVVAGDNLSTEESPENCMERLIKLWEKQSHKLLEEGIATYQPYLNVRRLLHDHKVTERFGAPAVKQALDRLIQLGVLVPLHREKGLNRHTDWNRLKIRSEETLT